MVAVAPRVTSGAWFGNRRPLLSSCSTMSSKITGANQRFIISVDTILSRCNQNVYSALYSRIYVCNNDFRNIYPLY